MPREPKKSETKLQKARQQRERREKERNCLSDPLLVLVFNFVARLTQPPIVYLVSSRCKLQHFVERAKRDPKWNSQLYNHDFLFHSSSFLSPRCVIAEMEMRRWNRLDVANGKTHNSPREHQLFFSIPPLRHYDENKRDECVGSFTRPLTLVSEQQKLPRRL
jgi:hypothetical protein